MIGTRNRLWLLFNSFSSDQCDPEVDGDITDAQGIRETLTLSQLQSQIFPTRLPAPLSPV